MLQNRLTGLTGKQDLMIVSGSQKGEEETFKNLTQSGSLLFYPSASGKRVYRAHHEELGIIRKFFPSIDSDQRRKSPICGLRWNLNPKKVTSWLHKIGQKSGWTHLSGFSQRGSQRVRSPRSSVKTRCSHSVKVRWEPPSSLRSLCRSCSFAPSRANPLATSTHDLRRGFYSCAASRLR